MGFQDQDFPPLPDFAFKLNERVLGQLVGCLRILSRALLLLIVVGLFTALFPFQPWQPAWHLKLGQAGFEYGATCLLAFLIALLAEFFEPDVDRALLRRMRLLTVANLAIVIFLLLIPMQVVSYGQLWFDSASQTQARIGGLTDNLTKLRQGIRGAGSVAELNAVMLEVKATPSAVLSGLPLPEQKRRLIESMDLQQSQLSEQFSQDRQQKLISLFFSTLRGVLGAGILAFAFLGCKRLMAP